MRRRRHPRLRRGGARALLDVLQPLLEQPDDVVVVGDVVDVFAGTARLHEPHAAQQAKLVGHRGLGQAEELREIADRNLGPREGIENPDPGRVAQDLEGFGQVGNGALVEEPLLQVNI